MSNEICWDNDCNAENVASNFDFIRSCLNFQQLIEKTEITDSGEIKTEKYQIQNSSKKQVIEKTFEEVQEIIKEKNEVKEVKEENNNNNNNKISSAFDW